MVGNDFRNNTVNDIVWLMQTAATPLSILQCLVRQNTGSQSRGCDFISGGSGKDR